MTRGIPRRSVVTGVKSEGYATDARIALRCARWTGVLRRDVFMGSRGSAAGSGAFSCSPGNRADRRSLDRRQCSVLPGKQNKRGPGPPQSSAPVGTGRVLRTGRYLAHLTVIFRLPCRDTRERSPRRRSMIPLIQCNPLRQNAIRLNGQMLISPDRVCDLRVAVYGSTVQVLCWQRGADGGQGGS
jgi:hypothetical protein